MRKKITAAFSIIAIILAIGTLFYHHIEGWSYVDSFYFTGITMLTIGYGDIAPTTAFSKIATVFFAISTVGIFLYCLSVIGVNLPGRFVKKRKVRKKTKKRKTTKKKRRRRR